MQHDTYLMSVRVRSPEIVSKIRYVAETLKSSFLEKHGLCVEQSGRVDNGNPYALEHG